MLFTHAEIKHLKLLYLEEIAHFRSVMADRMPDVFRECGERVGMRKIIQLYKVSIVCIIVFFSNQIITLCAYIGYC